MLPVPVSDRRSSVAGFVLSRRFVVAVSAAFGVFFFAVATKWTFDPWAIGKFWPGHFFSAQADAILQGRLWVKRSQLPGECVFVDGRCVGYFGLAPSVVRLPLVRLVGVERSEMTGLFLALAATISLWSVLDLCRRVLARDGERTDRWAAGYLFVAAVVLGPGGALLLVSDPYVYQEAILWSVAGVVVGTNLFWRWWTEGRDRQFVGAVVVLVVAASARPAAAAVGVVLAVAVLARCVRRRRSTRHALAGAIALALLPGLVMVAGFAAKFGTLLPPDDGYEGLRFKHVQEIVRNNGGEYGTSIRFIPTTAFAYVRPDTLRLSWAMPPVGFRFGHPSATSSAERITYLPPLAEDSINVEKTASITDVMPLAVMATLGASVAILVRRRRRFELAILVALATMPVIVCANQTIASRYLGDFFPLVAVGTAFGATLLDPIRRMARPVRTTVLVVVMALAVVSVPVAWSLATEYDWIYGPATGPS